MFSVTFAIENINKNVATAITDFCIQKSFPDTCVSIPLKIKKLDKINAAVIHNDIAALMVIRLPTSTTRFRSLLIQSHRPF